MNRQWIRIDRAHTAFDCSPREFEAFLSNARSEAGCLASDDKAASPSASPIPSDVAEESKLLESINAELAVLAALQRRDRISKAEKEQIARKAARIERGRSLAELHAAALRQMEGE